MDVVIDPYPDINLQLQDKKRNVRDDALLSIKKALLTPAYNEFSESLPNVVNNMISAFTRGCNPEYFCTCVTLLVPVIPESNCWGDLTQKLITRVSSASTESVERSLYSTTLGMIALYCGHFNDIHETVPSNIMHCLLNILEEYIVTNNKGEVIAYKYIDKVLQGILLACNGLPPQYLTGWVYNRLVCLLLYVIIFYPDSYAEYLNNVNETVVYNIFVYLIECMKTNDQQNVYRDSSLHESYALAERQDDDDEYYYTREVDEDIPFEIMYIRWSLRGVLDKLRKIVDSEIEVVDIDHAPTQLDALISALDGFIKSDHLEPDNVLVPAADMDLYITGVDERIMYTALRYICRDVLQISNKDSLSTFIKLSTYTQHLLYVEEVEVVVFSKDKASMMARRDNQRKNQVRLDKARRAKFFATHQEE